MLNYLREKKLISRLYKDCHPPNMASYFQEKCKHLFGEELWTRHQYQMSSPSVAHRRFVRPICQRVKRSDKDDNLMMVLPYIHWETSRHLGDPEAPSTLKELEEAIHELDKIRHPKREEDYEDDETTAYSSSYWSAYYTDSSSISSRSTRRTRRTRRSRSLTRGPDLDWMARVASEMLESEGIRAGQAPTERASERLERLERRKKRIQRIAKIAEEESYTADEKLILA